MNAEVPRRETETSSPPLCLSVFGFLHLCLVFVFREVGIVACSGALRCTRSSRGRSWVLFKAGIVLIRPRLASNA